jgi:hypothetical protein
MAIQGTTASNTDGGADDAPFRIGRVIDAAQAYFDPIGEPQR